MDTVLNPNLMNKAKRIADEKYPKASAMKTKFIIKKYLELGGLFKPKQKISIAKGRVKMMKAPRMRAPLKVKSEKKPAPKQIVNIYTQQPIASPFESPFYRGQRVNLSSYEMPYISSQTLPFINRQVSPFNQPISMPTNIPISSAPTVQSVSPLKPEEPPKPKRKYTKKQVVVGIPVSTGEIVPITAKEYIMPEAKPEYESEYGGDVSPQFMGGDKEQPIAKKRGRPTGSKNKLKEPPLDQPLISEYLEKIGGGSM